MKRQWLGAICTALLLTACGGSGDHKPDEVNDPAPPPPSGGGNEPQPEPQPPPPSDVRSPVPTESGTPLGAEVSKVIGAEGGAITSNDGSMTIKIPAGAFTSEQTVSIQPITNKAHGGRGRAFRIRPEGLETPVPMTVNFQYGDAELSGSTLEALTIAYQDADGIWHAYPQPSVVTALRTISVQTRHFSDWAMILGAQLLPNTGTVRVGESLELQVVKCERIAKLDETPGGELQIPMPVIDCETRPATSFLTSGWAVNGAAGGGAQYGGIVADPDRFSGKATYTAPSTKPARSTVSISARHNAPTTEDQITLVANVTVLDDSSSCMALRDVETFDAELSFDDVSFTARRPYHVHTGYHSGRIAGTLRKIDLHESAPFDVWFTYFDPLKGWRIVIDDSHVYTPDSGDGYTETFVASGRPYERIDAPSFIMLKVDYDSCTFDLLGSFMVEGTHSRNGASRDQLLGAGGVYIQGQALTAEQSGSRLLQGSLPLSLIGEPDLTGYFPHDPSGGGLRTFSGSTTARWYIAPTPIAPTP